MSIIEQATRRLEERRKTNVQPAAAIPVQRQPDGSPDLPGRPSVSWILASLVVGFALGVFVSGMLYEPASPAFSRPPQHQAAQPVQNEPARIVPTAPADSAQPAVAGVAQNNRNDKRQEVLKQVDNWVKAWSGKDLDNYLASYAPEFQPPGLLTRTDWEKQRRQRLAKYSKIKIQLSGMTVTTEGDTAIAEFVQSFKADGFSETGLRKRLELRRQDGRWLIVKEAAIKG